MDKVALDGRNETDSGKGTPGHGGSRGCMSADRRQY